MVVYTWYRWFSFVILVQPGIHYYTGQVAVPPYDHVTKCFVSKCEVGAKQYIATWMTHLETKHFIT